MFPLGILSVLEGWVSQRVNLEGGAGIQGHLCGRAPGWEASGDGARGSGSLSPTPTPTEGEVRASFGSRTLCSSHPVREAPEPSVLLQVTMADRAAAERACKDPNPNIDGRKANVNLAYLGAKPRSLQTGERTCVFLPRARLDCYIQCWYLWGGNGPPSVALPQEWLSAIMCLQNHHEAVLPQLGSWTPWSRGMGGTLRVGQGEEGTSPSPQLSWRTGGSWFPGLESGRTHRQRLLPPCLAWAGRFGLGGMVAWECRGSPLWVPFVGDGGRGYSCVLLLPGLRPSP